MGNGERNGERGGGGERDGESGNGLGIDRGMGNGERDGKLKVKVVIW